jgi:hypothetical protein
MAHPINHGTRINHNLFGLLCARERLRTTERMRPDY